MEWQRRHPIYINYRRHVGGMLCSRCSERRICAYGTMLANFCVWTIHHSNAPSAKYVALSDVWSLTRRSFTVGIPSTWRRCLMLSSITSLHLMYSVPDWGILGAGDWLFGGVPEFTVDHARWAGHGDGGISSQRELPTPISQNLFCFRNLVGTFRFGCRKIVPLPATCVKCNNEIHKRYRICRFPRSPNKIVTSEL